MEEGRVAKITAPRRVRGPARRADSMGGDAFDSTVGSGFLVEVLDHDREEFAGTGSLRRRRLWNQNIRYDEGGGQKAKRRNSHLTFLAEISKCLACTWFHPAGRPENLQMPRLSTSRRRVPSAQPPEWRHFVFAASASAAHTPSW